MLSANIIIAALYRQYIEPQVLRQGHNLPKR